MKQMLVTVNDYRRLIGLMEVASLKAKKPQIAEQLYNALMGAKMLPPENISSSVITMDSRVLVRDLSSGREAELTIVYPKDADNRQGKISVFSEIGIALLGQQGGDTVSWRVPAGNGQFEILEITYQPEAVGNYYS
jgi:regulator of nucleoside diphosphate kinase